MHPHFVVCGLVGLSGAVPCGSALAEVNRFPVRGPTVLKHCRTETFDTPRAGDGCDSSELPTPMARRRPLFGHAADRCLTCGIQVSTLEQSPESRRYGSEPQ